uniref:Uncharacterized protein n=1 Tax=Chromera velia CCMP2878 TaxID=1169474 RepID=A0A0G4HZ48_9ALVE|eukprot:Cvel_33825.t1-p1 / transcript=Cvel_33825.t1 / gene=Cvel_33825 / organism=Chromera_velia_CCMP2878 / gene_product=hypothetical protein / transcript_product=hypothetical protein / location=Cvel_scaffold5612:2669-3343(-) / protein_length=225 / sequence_SO=supercontig / SO=protein_coding / is_pseudo=false
MKGLQGLALSSEEIKRNTAVIKADVQKMNSDVHKNSSAITEIRIDLDKVRVGMLQDWLENEKKSKREMRGQGVILGINLQEMEVTRPDGRHLRSAPQIRRPASPLRVFLDRLCTIAQYDYPDCITQWTVQRFYPTQRSWGGEQFEKIQYRSELSMPEGDMEKLLLIFDLAVDRAGEYQDRRLLGVPLTSFTTETGGKVEDSMVRIVSASSPVSRLMNRVRAAVKA